jgi:PhnB protein
MSLNVYLFFDGRCAEALEFYARTLGGKIESKFGYDETPPEAKEQMPPGMENKVMHATLRVGDSVLFASDSPGDWYEKPQGFSVSLNIADVAEARRAFEALAEGGTVKMPFDKTFWAAGFGMLVDRFGTPWMVNSEAPQG